VASELKFLIDVLAVCESVHERIRHIVASVQLYALLLSSYQKCNRPDLVLTAWHEMVEKGLPADTATRMTVLSACASLSTPSAVNVAQNLFMYVSEIEEERGGMEHRKVSTVLSHVSPLPTSPTSPLLISIFSKIICRLSQRKQLYDAMLKVFIRGQKPQLAIELWRSEVQHLNSVLSKNTVLLLLQAGAATGGLDAVSLLHSSVISKSPELMADTDI
jgi:pentatricopeptide repeat protein